MNDGANERDIRAYEAAYASTYDFESVQVRFRREAVLASLLARKPRRVVEIGCGMEPLLPHYLASGNTIDSWVVVEPAPMFAQAARDAGKDCAGMVVIEDFYGDDVADRIVGEHGLADMVVCSGLLHEVADPMGLLHAIRKVMEDDALVHVNVPNAASLHRRLAKAMGLIHDLETLSDRNVELQQHRVYSLATLQRDLQAAGLRPVEDGGILMKPFTHAQMSTVVDALGSDILEGLAVLGRELPSSRPRSSSTRPPRPGDGVNIRIERYGSEHADAWASVLRNAKNGIFQFERAYMEYHADRFTDLSLLAFVDDQPVAILPAAIDAQGVVTSHPGLTFGGVVLDARIRSGVAFEVFDAMFGVLRESGGRRCVVKLLPAAFASYPSAELEYALWRRGFTLQRRDLSSLLPLGAALPFNSSKLQGAKKASKAGVEVAADEVSVFHALLQAVLSAKHGVAPVHSSEELELLQGRFPERIFCRLARLRGDPVAGALVFDYGRVWHTQYLACSDEGRDAGALDLVVQELIREARERGTESLSFGTSTVEAGRVVNEGLLWQKESYGARAIVHDFYEGDL